MHPSPLALTEALIDRFEDVERLLEITYGPRILRESDDPVSGLVGTILSQNTSHTNSSRAMATLRDRFPTWDLVRDAAVEDLVDAIRSGGLANRKAPQIQTVLEEIERRQGAIELEFLEEMPLEEAKGWLTSMHGVGAKTAACVLLFSLGQPAMPVDTHVHRVSLRIGLVQLILEGLLGDDAQRVYAFHVEMIEHGRTICRAQRPKCPECPLREYCDYYAEHHLT
jgi:endonuclease-3